MEDYKEGFDKELSYDLRQRRAKFIGDCIEELIASMKSDNFYAWLKNIDDLYDVSEHMFSNEETTKEFTGLRNEVILVANQYTSTWLGKDKTEKAVAEIEIKLRSLVRFLLKKIEMSGAFGTKSYDEDEI